jgi:glycosyltransferase involved in cell wall biosynthesis
LLTVFDMTHERYPRLFAKFDRTASAKAIAAARADHIICISESTRRDLIEMLHVDESRTSVVHLAHNPLRLLAHSAFTPSGRPFVLFVGSRGGYKNFLPFLKAFSLSMPRRDGHRLICFGGGAFNRVERASIEAFGLSEMDVVALDGPDELLGELYGAATLFAYPSLYEGFGMPLLEAMSLGCPVVCSNSSAFPEVVGEAAEVFDPGSVEAMTHSLEIVAYDRVRRNELILSGRKRALCFSWDRCAEETLAVYRRVSGV